MSKCHPKKYATDYRDPVTKEKKTGYVFSCTPCGIFGKLFASKAGRDKFAASHQ